MLKNDYMKEVENTLQLVRDDVDKNIANGDIDKAKERVNKELKSLIGLDIKTIDVFSFKSIEELLCKDVQYNSEKFIAFACLMNLEGIIASRENNDNAKISYYEKSLEGFYKAYMEDDDINTKYLEDAVEAANELSNYELSLDLDRKILRLYEMANKLDKAEDTIFYMLRKTNNDGSIILEGMKFYNRLKQRETDELKEGNLPIEEIEDGILELERRLGL